MVKLITKGVPNRYYIKRHVKGQYANCVYLNQERICSNSRSSCYGGKCFSATYCTFRVKKEEVEKEIRYLIERQELKNCILKKNEPKREEKKRFCIAQRKTEKMLKTIGSVVQHKSFGRGVVIAASSKTSEIMFDNGRKVLLSIETCLQNDYIEVENENFNQK